MALTNPWRLTLLFIVSGAASRFMLDRLGAGAFARARAPRLLVPLLFGTLVVVPPQTWLQVAQLDGDHAMPYGDFYLRYLTGSGGWSAHGASLGTPTWNHLWFVAYLLVYTLLLALVCAGWRAMPAVASAAAKRLSTGVGIAAPAAWFAFVHLALLPRFPETHALFGDWTAHAESAPAFLFGFAAARAPSLWAELEHRRRPLAALAIALNMTYAGSLALLDAGVVPAGLARPVMAWSFGFDQWLTAAAILACASARLRRFDHPCRRYLTDAIFPFYIVHQTIIVGMAAALRPLDMPPALEAAIIVGATVAGCVATYETVRRVPPLRPLFGLKQDRGGSRGAGAVVANRSAPA